MNKVVIIRHGIAQSMDEKKRVVGEICWFIDNVATRKNINEILAELFIDGYEIKSASEKHYVLFKGEQ